jgi:addiction module HigA family antidote
MAFRLSKAFGTSAELWLNLQNGYDLWLVQRKTGDLENIKNLVPA